MSGSLFSKATSKASKGSAAIVSAALLASAAVPAAAFADDPATGGGTDPQQQQQPQTGTYTLKVIDPVNGDTELEGIAADTTVASALESKGILAPEKAGYRFIGYYTADKIPTSASEFASNATANEVKINEDTVVSAFYMEAIGSVKLELKRPEIGGSASEYPVIAAVGDAPYTVSAGGWLYGVNEAEPFDGTFADGESYSVTPVLTAAFGYYFDDKTPPAVEISGADGLKDIVFSGDYYDGVSQTPLYGQLVAPAFVTLGEGLPEPAIAENTSASAVDADNGTSTQQIAKTGDATQTATAVAGAIGAAAAIGLIASAYRRRRR